MKKILGFSVMGLVLASSIIFTSCGGSKKVALEAAFPANSDLVLVADYSQSAQRANLENLLGRFPKIEGMDAGVAMLVTQMNMGLNQVGLNWEKDIQPIFDKPWKVGFSFSFPEEKKAEGSEDLRPSLRTMFANLHINVAFQLDAAGKFEDLLDKLIKNSKSTIPTEIKEEAGVKYWMENGRIILARYGDVFVVAINPDDIKPAVQQLKDGSGMAKNESFVAFSKQIVAGNLGYAYMGKGFLSKYMQGVQSLVGKAELDGGYFLDVINSIESGFEVVSAEKDGFRFQAITELTKDSRLLADFYPNRDYKTIFDKKIPAKGVVLYLEQANFRTVLKSALDVFGQISNSKPVLFKETGLPDDPAKDAVPADFYSESMKYVADRSGLTVAELEALSSSPYSVVMSDVGQIFPTVSLYWQLDASKLDSAKKLVAAVDKNIDDILKGMAGFAISKDGTEASFKKDSVVVQGGGLHKVSVSWQNLPGELLKISADEFELLKAAGIDLQNFKMDLNYGITGDNVLVLGLYPGFADDYGKNVLADEAQYKEALARVNGGSYGRGYMDFAKFMGIFKKFADVGIGMKSSNQTPAQMANIKKVIDAQFAFFATIKYVISSEVFEGDLMKEDVYVRIEKVGK